MFEYLSICQNDLFQIDEKCTFSLNNQQLGGHQAILTIVNALKHGRSIREIILACSFSELSQSHIKEWSKALVSLANEICSMKHVSIVTTGSQYEERNPNTTTCSRRPLSSAGGPSPSRTSSSFAANVASLILCRHS